MISTYEQTRRDAEKECAKAALEAGDYETARRHYEQMMQLKAKAERDQ